MKVKELIEHLQRMPQDLEVYGYCNHGQCPEKASLPIIGYTEDIVRSLWDSWSSVKEEAAEMCYRKKFVIL